MQIIDVLCNILHSNEKALIIMQRSKLCLGNVQEFAFIFASYGIYVKVT